MSTTTSTALKVQRSLHPIVLWLKEQTSNLLQEIQSQPFWSALMNPRGEPEFLQAIMAEVYADIVAYQPHVIEAAIAAIAQMPRTVNSRHIRSMLVHQAEEFDHGEMARRDLQGLGRSRTHIEKGKLSPESFAVAAVWWMLVHLREPFAYLGALFLFECLTPTVTAIAKQQLQSKGFGSSSLEYIEFHSTEDVKHANLIEYLISEIAESHPESVESIRDGFKRFRVVYPIPLWNAAFARASKTRSSSADSDKSHHEGNILVCE